MTSFHTHRWIEVPGGRVKIRIAGDGPGIPLIVLHGGPGSTHDYLRNLAALGDERPVILYDQLGSGESEHSGDRSLWHIGRFVRELAAIVETLGYHQVHVLGHSWGTMLALDWFLAGGREKTATLSFVSPCLSARRILSDMERLRRELPQAVRDTLALHEARGTTDSGAYRAAMRVFYQRHLCRLDPWPEVLSSDEGFSWEVYGTMWGPSEMAFTGNLSAYEGADRLGEVDVPALFSCGRYDEITPESAAAYCERVPGSRLEIFEASAHMPNLEEPERFLEVVRSFLSEAERQPATLIDLLRARAGEKGDAPLYTFLADGEAEEATLSYGGLDRRARAIGARLQQAGAAGERALLLYPPGLDFIAAFFGCLYAGAVAVPAYPPHAGRTQPRLRAIAGDARPRLVLTTAAIAAKAAELSEQIPELAGAEWIATESLDSSAAERWTPPSVGPGTLAFLQYTSGSTATPKGVMVTHGNLLHNERLIGAAFGMDEESVVVGWLPLYHDMGLIGNVLQPLHAGGRCVLMSPVAFLQRPMRWLEAVSRYRGTVSGGPNFAYELCLRKAAPEALSRLDLSSWRVAYNGAEPVRASTLERFAETFAPCGFRREALYPCYGLAEATLFVTGGHGSRVEQERVSCGSAWQRVVTVDPETGEERREGEIWISSPSVACGYWGNEEATARDFHAFLPTGEGPFLRTGDLGFLSGGELYVTGRLKDLIILRGRNHYPQDVELTAERSHPDLHPGGGAAFSVEMGGEERLVVVHEAVRHRREGVEEIAEAVRRAVASEHEVQVHEVVLIRQAGLPKTSSGKVQRRLCRELYLRNELPVVGRSALAAADPAPELAASLTREALEGLGPEERRGMLAAYLRERASMALGVPVGLDQPLTGLGLDSLSAIELRGAVESALGLSLPLADLLQGITVASLADRLLAEAEVPPLRAHGPASEAALSAGQRGLWFLHRLAPEGGAYNIAVAARVRGLDPAALERALSALARRHEALRTVFPVVGDEPVQRVLAELAPDVRVEEDLARLSAEAWRPFNLETGPLLRARIFTGQGEPVLLLVVHHIVADFTSLAIMGRDLAALYRGEALEPPALRYADYVRWQRELLAGPRGERLWSYWRERLEGVRDLDLPADHPRPPVQTWRGDARALALPPDLVASLGALASGSTPFMVLLAAFQAQLGRYTGQEDFAVGAALAGRPLPELSSLVGYFVNLLPLRVDLTEGPSFGELLSRARRAALEGIEHGDFPFPLIAERLRPVRDPARPPLFQTMLVFQRARPEDPAGLAAFSLGEAGARLELGGLTLESVRLPERRSQLDFSIYAAEDGRGGIGLSLEFNADLFDGGTAERMLGHLRTLLEGAVAAPEVPFWHLPLLSEAERGQFFETWDDTACDYPSGLLHQLFEAQVERTPKAEAVVSGEARLTYAELNARANRLAHRLRRLGVGPEDRVGVCLRRSERMIVSLLAVLKAGGAYVPLDPTYPRERLKAILEDSAARVVIGEEATASRLAEESGDRWLSIDEDLSSESAGNPVSVATPSNLAYLIYTSGSTGKPKAVAIEHRSPVVLMHWSREVFSPEELAGTLASTSVGFDVSVFEIFAPLSWGGRIFVVESLLSLPGMPEASEVRLVAGAPSVVAELVRIGKFPSWVRTVNLGGEAVPPALVEGLAKAAPGMRIVNAYGPSEDTTYTTIAFLEPGEPVAIGRPVANTRIYLLDRHGEPVPARVPGELYIAGEGLARGYLDRPELTAEKYVPNPFSAEPGARLYRVADLARRRPDGLLDYLGRIDHQVKIRGFRVELGEIEAALARHPGVREAVVMAREDGDRGKRLVAYVTPRGVASSELRGFLKESLPDYMVPAAFVHLDALPLSPNGKVDRKALPDPGAPAAAPAPAPAFRGPVVEALTALMAETLGIERVRESDDFFELGGHSLLATRLAARASRLFGVEVPVSAVLLHPTAAALASQILAAGAAPAPVRPLRRRAGEPLPASHAQRRLWFLDRLEPGSPAYHLPGAIRLAGPLDADALEEALAEIVRRHEALRTVLRERRGEPVQIVEPPPAAVLKRVDLSGAPDSEAARLARETATAPFDLARGPLCRALLLRRGPEDHELLLTLHHVVADGWSLGILLAELAALYEAFAAGLPSPLAELPVQYADWAVWQRERPRMDVQIAWWRERLAGSAPLRLPADRPRPAVRSSRGGTVSTTLPAEGIEALARRAGVTPFMALLAAFQAQLARYSEASSVPVGSPVANRGAAEVEGLIGFFVNMLVLRTPVEGDPTFLELLERVREVCLGAYAHQDVPFERLVEELRPERRRARNPLFQAVFQLEEPLRVERLGAAAVTVERLETGTAKFDLMLSVVRQPEGLAATLEYDADLFDPSTAERLLGHWRRLAEGISADPQARLSGLLPLSAEEIAQLRSLPSGVEDDGFEAPAAVFVAPRTPEEERLAAIWSEVLGVEGVGVHDDFFELGGHSLLAVRMLARVREEFGVDPPVSLLFEAPTLAALAARLDGYEPLPEPEPDIDEPLPVRQRRHAEYVAPEAGAEERLAAIWSEVLGVERVGVHDDFFDLGGHSLLAVRMLARVQEELGVDLPVRVLVDAPTVAGLAARLDGFAPLPEPEEGEMLPDFSPRGRRAAGYAAPRTEAEERLAAIWSEVLGVERVGVNDDFFDLGGHSLLAIRMLARLQEAMGIDLPLSELVEAPTVAELAGRLTGAVAGAAPPVPEMETGERLPLSLAQQRLWLLDRLEPGSPKYNVPVAVRLAGALAIRPLARALAEIVRRHEPLRTVYARVAGEPVQIVQPSTAIPFARLDLGGLPGPAAERALRDSLRAEAARPFDLAAGPVVRFLLAELGAGGQVLLGTFHHIAMDGWSVAVFFRELAVLYTGFAAGRLPSLPEPAMRYAGWALWQRQALEGGALDPQIAWWRRALAGLPVLELPTDRPRSGAGDRGATRPVAIPAALSRGLRRLGRRERATTATVLMTGLAALLARLSGQDDFGIGLPAAGRGRLHTEELIGFFINTLVVRARAADGPSFAALLRRLRDVQLAAQARQDVPFERLVEELQPERAAGVTPLFQVAFNALASPLPAVPVPGLALSLVDVDLGVAKFDLTLSVYEEEGLLRGWAEYRTGLFDPATVERWMGSLRTLLAAAAADPALPLSELPLLSPAERWQLAGEHNDTALALPLDRCLHELFEAQAARSPGAPAVIAEDGELTYRQLDAWAERLARRLRRLGVGPEVAVGLFVERSAAMVAAILGVLKAGGAYLPLDPAYPAERLAGMLDDTGAPVLLAPAALLDRLPPHRARVLVLEGEESDEEETAAPRSTPDHLAAVLFTSGSTGRPKGVMLHHRGLANRLLWAQETYRLTPDDAVLLKAAFGFDFAIWETFAPLIAGARLVVARPGGHLDAGYLARVIAEQGVTIVHFVPSMLDVFLGEEGAIAEGCPSLRQVFSGGEALSPALRERFLARFPGVPLDNQYGPTEISIDTTRWVCAPGQDPRRVPLGRPIGNTRVHLLDRALQPVPAGVPGALHVAGAGVARGYLGRPELTAERFLPDPWGNGGRLYDTGDLARRLPDGTLEFLGRADAQVKVRGVRVEPGEVEAALLRHPAVAAAAVGTGPEGARLIAWVVLRPGEEAAPALLREHLRGWLPEAMIPSLFVPLEALPLTPSGKLDRRALPVPEGAPEGGFVASRTQVEEVIAVTFAALLQVGRVGVEDDFFALGGHSLLATRLVSLLRDALGVELPVSAVFSHPTPAGLAREVESAAGADLLPPVQRVPRGGPLPQSYSQARLWFLHQLAPWSPAYNMAVAVRFVGPLDVPALSHSLDEIVRRHEVLRSTFDTLDGQPVQRVGEAAPVPLPAVDLTGLPPAAREREIRRVAGEEGRRPFDLVHGPVARMALLVAGREDHHLLLNIHHIAGDGWSSGVLTRELEALYPAFLAGEPSPLPELPVQFADFAVWQRRWLDEGHLESQLAYWREQLRGAPPLLALATDRPRPEVQSFAGTHLDFHLPAETARALQALGRAHGATLYMAMLAAFSVLLGRWSGQSDVVVGSPIANRRRAELEPLVGFFVNTVTLRTHLARGGDPTFLDLLAQVRETTLGAYMHQDLPFEKLVEELQPERQLGHSPLFQVLYVYQNTPGRADRIPLPGLAISMRESEGLGSQLDLTMILSDEADGRLKAGLYYSTELFDAVTVERLWSQLAALVEGAAAGPASRLPELPGLAEAEREVLLRQRQAPVGRERVRGMRAAGLLPSTGELREFLASRLPEYMVPSAFVYLDALPLTYSGKRDLRALPAPEPADQGQEVYVAPRTPAEETLAELVAGLLKRERVGVESNLFEMGGHSLMVMQLVGRVRDTFGAELTVQKVFETPTVAGLAAVVDTGRWTPPPPSIRPVPRNHPLRPLPLSFAQERLWLVDQLQPGGAVYNMPMALRLRGALDPAALERAFAGMVSRHESLRTTFAALDGRPVQVIAPAAGWSLPVEDLSAFDDPEAEALRRAAEEARRPFDLERGPVMRTRLFRLGPEDHALVVSLHHIVADLWSMAVLIREVTGLYAGEALPELPVQYADFAVWQRAWLDGAELDRQLGFWRRELDGAPEALELPTDRPRPPVESFRGAAVPVALGGDLSRGLAALARAHDATPFMLMTAGLAALFSRWSGQDDLVLGSPIANRRSPELERLLGMFVNTLALRVRPGAAHTFPDLLAAVRGTVLGAFDRQDLPFEKLVEELKPRRDLSRHPLFQVVLAFQNVELGALEIPGLRLEPVELDSATTKFDLTFTLAEGEEGIAGRLEYATDLFDESTVERLLRHLRNLLAGIAAAPAARLEDLPLLGEEERLQLLAWSGAAPVHPREATIPGLFAERAAGAPEAVAVVWGDEEVTYGELDRGARRVAARLLRMGLPPESRIAVVAERSPALIAALLGILQAGHAYLPLDPDLPEERRRFLLEGAGAILFDLKEEGQQGLQGQPAISPDQLAYVMYTSGSTGSPKGVAVTHGNVVRLVTGADWADLGPEQTFLQLANPAFDAATLEIWAPLLNGGRLVLFPGSRPALEDLAGAIARHGVTTLWLTAGLFHQMVNERLEGLRPLRQLLAGGDVLSPSHVRRALEGLPGCVVVNGYGPTENTTFTTCFPMRSAAGWEATVPIGRPIRGTRVRVLDAALRPVPVGVWGELLAGGDGVARGYLGRPDLTAERFVPDPSGDGERLYRTGDLVRWRPDGLLEFLGRRDGQVKVRGFRIELGEIEAALAAVPGAREVAVVVRSVGSPADRRLVAYVAGDVAEPELRRHLAARLPDYMIPAAFVILERLPLTPNGKVDRRALPDPDPAAGRAREYLAPSNPIEESLAAACAEVLGLEQVGMRDNFFALGGHSLLAARLVSRLRDSHALDVPMRMVFEAADLQELADRLVGQVVSEIGDLSAEEIQALLSAEETAP